MFHFCSSWKLKTRDGAKLWLESAYTLRRWLSRRHEIHAPMCLSEAVRSGDVGLHRWTELLLVDVYGILL
jgi:hypothetical protein